MSKPPRTITRCPPSAPGRGYLRWAQVAPGVPAVLVSPGRDGCIRHDHGWGGQGPGSTPAPRGTEGPPMAPMHSGKGWDGGGGELEEKGSSTDGEDTHLLASLAGNARGTREPGITHAVRVRAVTLWGAGGTRQGLGPALPAAHGRALPSQVPLEANLRSPKPQLLPQWGYGAGSCPSGNQPCSTLGDQGTQTSSAPGAGRGCRVARFTHPSLLRSRELGKALEENPGVTQGSPAGGHWGNRGARSPTFCTPRVLSTLCSSLHRPLHRTNPSPSPGTPSRAGRTSRTSIPRACPERAQPCKRLLLCTTAT